jgi:glycosyltransferase involved in cell wall biosynthesis
MNLPLNKKAVLFVPFWRMPGHVGNNRVDRFVRWLTESGYQLVIVRAGPYEAVKTEVWGQEITVVDALGLHPEAKPGETPPKSPRKPNKLRKAVAYWLFNPDPVVVWAKAASKHPEVIKATMGAQFILSSSPPDSAHVGAWILSKKTGVPHIVDMRDGWLDEPLKALLINSAFRRWREGRLESKIAHHATAIQVTSTVWKKLFDVRYPHLANKVHVLTNAYPAQALKVTNKPPKALDEPLVLIHAGRFLGSRHSQHPELLLNPLLKHLEANSSSGEIRFYGQLSDEEIQRIQVYGPRLSQVGWHLTFPGAVPRSEILEAMRQADGLLLLSASHAALPSKLFEYLATGLPIGFVAEQGSAAELALNPVSQAHNLQSNLSKDFPRHLTASIKIPEEYSEAALAQKFKANCFK